ncbi:MAG: HAMP domain-containing histidine kinase [Rhodocyclaceae bacterium]|nr:HAMP domain-containing histidine kinase [Rhodocyclaceae bacterium]
MNSLRRKITAGYSAIAALVVGLSLLSLVELRLVEEQIAAGEHIGEFFGITLEIRRFEKNYFLYHQTADLAENGAYVAQARRLLRDHRALFESLIEPDRISRLAADLERYGELMTDYGQGGTAPRLAANIRQTGKDIVTLAEELARAERQALQAMLDRHRRLLISSVVLVGLLVVVIGQLLARRVGRPLKEMEARMEAVAAGRLTRLDMAAEDREIASLTEAFNRMLKELELRQGQLVRSEKLAALGTLLSGVAHELNNPLSNISTSCQILTEEIDGHDIPFKKELLGQIDDETWRARRIVRSLLDYARDRDFKREPLSLARLVDDTLRLIRGRIPAQTTVTVDIPEGLEVAGDRQRLQQVLINLVGNAIEALDGAGEVAIAARRTTEPWPKDALVFGPRSNGDAVEIIVHDNGHGIPAAALSRICDPFFTTKDVGQGLGLGLFIVFEIIEEHGGCMAVESESGRGTTFRVRLPWEKS